MKKVKAPKIELEELRDVDAEISGLPLPGRIWPPGGSAVLGDGITDWTGWTRLRYDVEVPEDPEYPVDEVLEINIEDEEKTQHIPPPKLARCKNLVKKATPKSAIAQPEPKEKGKS